MKVITGLRENKFVSDRVAQLDIAWPSVLEVPGDITSLIHLLSFLCSFN